MWSVLQHVFGPLALEAVLAPRPLGALQGALRLQGLCWRKLLVDNPLC